MASLTRNPEGVELEDFVAGHFVSRGLFVESGVTHRDPKGILELDLVCTDYSVLPPGIIPIEIKSGNWTLGELFKFYGWTRYLWLPPGQFVCRSIADRAGESITASLCKKMGIELVHIESADNVAEKFSSLGLPDRAQGWLPELWRYSLRAQRRLRKVLSIAVQNQRFSITARIARDYDKLINDVIFFELDPRARVEAFLNLCLLLYEELAPMPGCSDTELSNTRIWNLLTTLSEG